jgi:peptidoglycan/LPS O-acetylase OafA/YrhL
MKNSKHSLIKLVPATVLLTSFPRIVYADGDDTILGGLFEKLEQQFLKELQAIVLPLAIICFTGAAVYFFGFSKKDEKIDRAVKIMLYAMAALVVVAFGPTIVRRFWNYILQASAGAN